MPAEPAQEPGSPPPPGPPAAEMGTTIAIIVL